MDLRQMDKPTMIHIIARVLVIALIIAITVILHACTSDNDFEKGKKHLENMGYTNVRNTGYNFFCCSKGETYSTGFTCLDKNDEVVNGCICSSALKGITIRFE